MSSNLIARLEDPSNEWVQLISLDTPDLIHLKIEHLPQWARDFADALSKATETPSELAAGMVLVACSTVVSRRLCVMVKEGYFEPCNLWIVVALPPGNRKSAVQSSTIEPIIQWEREQTANLEPEIKRITSELKTMEARAKEIRNKAAKEKDPNKANELGKEAADIEMDLPEIPNVPQLWTSDATPERLGSLLADNDECMAWLSSEGGIFDLLQGRYSNGIPNLDLVLKAHSGDSERVDRGSRVPVYLRHPLLTIGLSPQPEVLRGLANKTGFRSRGLLARFLYLLPPSPLGYRELKTTPIPEKISNDYFSGIYAMLQWEQSNDKKKKHHILELSEGAYLEWHEFQKAIEIKMRPGNEMELYTDLAGKAPGAAARLSGVLHGIKHAHGSPWEAVITQETMQEALEIISVCLQHSLAAMGIMGTDPTITSAKKVWHWIERNKMTHFTLREAFNALRGTFSRVPELRKIFEILEERGYLRIIEPEKSGPGRRSELIVVRPDISKDWQ